MVLIKFHVVQNVMGTEGLITFKIIQILKVNEYSSLKIMSIRRVLCDQPEVGYP